MKNTKRKTKGVKGVESSALLAALRRCMESMHFACSMTTVVNNVKVKGRRVQIQVRTTNDESEMYDIKHAGIKCG